MTKIILRFFLSISCVAFALLYLAFCVYYLANGHSKLLSDFENISGTCFYRMDQFQTKMFSEETKSLGDLYCLFAIPCVVVFGYSIYNDLVKLSLLTKLRAFTYAVRRSGGWVITLLIICLAIAYWGHSHQAMCSDEAFSAFNFAEMPVAHLISYYPIPNNHVFFNFLNHFATLIIGDPLLSGRILAAIFYSLLILGNFFLFRYFTRHNFLSFLCSILLSLQFMVYGFGHQARGYSLYYFLYWSVLMALYGYFFQNGKSRKEALIVLMGCNILGLWTIPVFIYAIIVQLIFGTISMIAKKRFDLAFVRMLLLSGIGTFLVYLPLLNYSGLAAVIPRPMGERQSLLAVFKDLPVFFGGLAQLSFGFLTSYNIVALVVFLVPIILYLLFRQGLKKLFPLLLLYFGSWFAVLLMAFVVRQFPFYRIIGVQMHISFAILLLFIVVLIVQAKKFGNIWIGSCFVIFVLAAIAMVRFDRKFEDTDLYGQNPNQFMKGLQSMPLDFPKNTSIWVSDESFMWHFLLKDFRNVQAHACNFNNQDVLFLSEDDKPLPDDVLSRYREKSRLSWFVVYQRVK